MLPRRLDMFTISEATLVRLKAGDSAAWEEVFPPLWSSAYTIVREVSGKYGLGLSHEDIEEKAADALLKLIKVIGGVRNPEHLGRLLANIAAGQAIDRFRVQNAVKRGKRLTESLDKAIDERGDAALALAGTEQEMEGDRWILAERMERAMAKLDGMCRSLLEAVHVDGASYGELEKRFDANAGALRKRAHVCLKQLRSIWGKLPSSNDA